MIIADDSLLNGINGKWLSEDNRCEIKNFPEGTTETILEEVWIRILICILQDRQLWTFQNLS